MSWIGLIGTLIEIEADAIDFILIAKEWEYPWNKSLRTGDSMT